MIVHPKAPAPKVFKPVSKAPPESSIAACTAQHIGDRKEQQDRVFLLSKSPKDGNEEAQGRCAIAVLADGLGGMSGGSLASENVALIAKSRFEEFIPGINNEARFFDELVQECHAVLSIAAITSALQPHSTFTSLLVQHDRVDWCHVGDSRIYHFRSGRMMSVTEDHTLAWQMVRDGKATPEKAAMHPSAHKLVNTLGAQATPFAVHGSLLNPRPGDSFLLCSDGLWSYFEPHELATLIDSLPAGQAGSRLISIARERAQGKGDNCSLALIKFEGQAQAQETDLVVNSRLL